MSLIFKKNFSEGEFCCYSQKPTEIDLTVIDQIHSEQIVTPQQVPCQADGIIQFNEQKNILAIKTADCLPLLVFGQKGHALIHAGWRGLQLKILANQKLKALEPFFLFIGPSIQFPAYQVSENFKEYFPQSSSFSYHSNQLIFDLQKEAQSQFLELYPNATVENSLRDTFTDASLHSYRRDKTAERNWNVFIPHRN